MTPHKQLVWTVLLGAAVLALVVLAVKVAGLGAHGVEASHDPVTLATSGEDVGFDMIIDDDGDTVADNGPAVLGPIDPCIAVTAGSALSFDVFLDGIPTGTDLSGFNYRVQPLAGFNLDGLGVTARDNATAGINILTNQGVGLLIDLSDTPPLPLTAFSVAPAEIGSNEAPPTTVQGVLTRFTVSTNAGPDGIAGNGDDAPAAVGLYPMVVGASFGVFASTGGEIIDADDQFADATDTDGDTLVDEDSIIDAFDVPGFGVIAVGDVNGDSSVDQSDCVGLVPNVIIASLDCNSDPEVVTIKNTGGASEDLTGWELQSDPTSDPNQLFDLTNVGIPVADGMLDPGEQVSIFSGSLAPISSDPIGGNYLWDTSFKYRDGDTSDFAAIVDAAGAPIDQVDCSLLPTPTPTPTPTATPTPTRTPTPTPTATPGQLPTVGSAPASGDTAPWLALALGAGFLLMIAGGFGASRAWRRLRG